MILPPDSRPSAPGRPDPIVHPALSVALGPVAVSRPVIRLRLPGDGGLPLIGPALARWTTLVLAHSAARREGKALLFAELAEAARQGMPLDLALANCACSERERAGAPRDAWPEGAAGRHRVFHHVVGFFVATCLQFAAVLYLLTSFRLIDAEAIARRLALRLYRLVSLGMPLSQAMSLCGADYDPAERGLVAAGEQWNSLPLALRRASEFQSVDARLSIYGSSLLYPFWLILVLGTIGVFSIHVVLPKFSDIYVQIGARELPPLTKFFLSLDLMFAPWASTLAQLLVPVAWFVLFRSLLTGSRSARWVAAALMIMGLGWVPIVVAISASKSAGHGSGVDPFQAVSTALLTCAGVLGMALLLAPALLGLGEAVVLGIERLLARGVRHLPLVGAAARAQAEARWLAAMAVAIEVPVPLPEAMRAAGRICGGGLARRSAAAAALAEAGASLGDACVRHRVLRPVTNHRLRLAEAGSDLPKALHAIAEDAAQSASDTLLRTGRIVGILVLVIIGTVFGSFAAAFYMPMFEIPNILKMGIPDMVKQW